MLNLNTQNKNLYVNSTHKQYNSAVENSITSKDVNFKAGQPLISSFFRSFEYNQILGPAIVDMTSMVLPRTYVSGTRVTKEDKEKGKNFNAAAAIQAFFRESSSLVTLCILPYAFAKGASLFNKNVTFNNNDLKEFNLHKIKTNNEIIDKFADVYKGESGKTPSNKEFLTKLVESLEGLDGKDKKAWKSIDKNDIDNIVEKFEALINQKDKDAVKEAKKELNKLLGETLSARKSIKVLGLETEVQTFVDDAHLLTKAFEKSKELGVDGLKTVKNALNKGIAVKTLAGIGIVGTIAFNLHGINKYLTKITTGKTGNVSTGRSEDDKSASFKLQKTLAMLGFAGLSAASLSLDGVWKKTPKETIKKLYSAIQFKNPFPRTSQLKVLYTSVILGRLFKASDKDELRETGLRDSIGFATWLVFGDFVNKGIVRAFDKNLINKGGSNFLSVKTKTVDEVLDKVIKEQKIDISNLKGEKGVFSKILNSIGIKTPTADVISHLKELAKTDTKNPEAIKKALKELNVLNKGQIGGLVFSCLALGFGIPYLNKYMTNQKEALKKQNLNNENNSIKTNSETYKMMQNTQGIINSLDETNV